MQQRSRSPEEESFLLPRQYAVGESGAGPCQFLHGVKIRRRYDIYAIIAAAVGMLP